MLIPNLCDDAPDCSLATADNWLRSWVPKLLATGDFTSGRLAVVITADEDDGSQGNKVMTVVLHPSPTNRVVADSLTHYSLTRFYAQVNHTSPLRQAATAPSMSKAFGLSVG